MEDDIETSPGELFGKGVADPIARAGDECPGTRLTLVVTERGRSEKVKVEEFGESEGSIGCCNESYAKKGPEREFKDHCYNGGIVKYS